MPDAWTLLLPKNRGQVSGISGQGDLNSHLKTAVSSKAKILRRHHFPFARFHVSWRFECSINDQ